ncbi:MAG: hypothetical protein ChlgKO_03710 [Chlamydiales bacterium]
MQKIKHVPYNLYLNAHPGRESNISIDLFFQLADKPNLLPELVKKHSVTNGISIEQASTELRWVLAMQKIQSLLSKDDPLKYVDENLMGKLQQILDPEYENLPNEKALNLRNREMTWLRRDPESDTEIVFFQFLNNFTPDVFNYFLNKLSPDRFGSLEVYKTFISMVSYIQKQCPIIFESTLLELGRQDRDCKIPFEVLTTYLESFNQFFPFELIVKDRRFCSLGVKLDKSVLEKLCKKDEKGWINLVDVFKNIYHSFPDSKVLPKRFEISVEKIRNENIDPVVRASTIWVDCVTQHYCFCANKRTGRALSILVLLANGIIPPSVANEEKSYLLSDVELVASNDPYRAVEDYMSKLMRNQNSTLEDPFGFGLPFYELD